jgi:hypothetical protein
MANLLCASLCQLGNGQAIDAAKTAATSQVPTEVPSDYQLAVDSFGMPAGFFRGFKFSAIPRACVDEHLARH